MKSHWNAINDERVIHNKVDFPYIDGMDTVSLGTSASPRDAQIHRFIDKLSFDVSEER